MFKKLLRKLFKTASKTYTPRRQQAPRERTPKQRRISLEEFKRISENKLIQAQATRIQKEKERIIKVKESAKFSRAKREFKKLQAQARRLMELEQGVMKYERANKRSYTGLEQSALLDITKVDKQQISKINKNIREKLSKFNLEEKTDDYIQTFFHILSRLEENPYDPITEEYAYNNWNKKYVQTELADFIRYKNITKQDLQDIIGRRNTYITENETDAEMISTEQEEKLLEILEMMELI